MPDSRQLLCRSDAEWFNVTLVFDARRGGRREGRLETNILTKTRLHQDLCSATKLVLLLKFNIARTSTSKYTFPSM